MHTVSVVWRVGHIARVLGVEGKRAQRGEQRLQRVQLVRVSSRLVLDVMRLVRVCAVEKMRLARVVFHVRRVGGRRVFSPRAHAA